MYIITFRDNAFVVVNGVHDVAQHDKGGVLCQEGYMSKDEWLIFYRYWISHHLEVQEWHTRWQRIKCAMTHLSEFEPIDVIRETFTKVLSEMQPYFSASHACDVSIENISRWKRELQTQQYQENGHKLEIIYVVETSLDSSNAWTQVEMLYFEKDFCALDVLFLDKYDDLPAFKFVSSTMINRDVSKGSSIVSSHLNKEIHVSDESMLSFCFGVISLLIFFLSSSVFAAATSFGYYELRDRFPYEIPMDSMPLYFAVLILLYYCYYDARISISPDIMSRRVHTLSGLFQFDQVNILVLYLICLGGKVSLMTTEGCKPIPSGWLFLQSISLTGIFVLSTRDSSPRRWLHIVSLVVCVVSSLLFDLNSSDSSGDLNFNFRRKVFLSCTFVVLDFGMKTTDIGLKISSWVNPKVTNIAGRDKRLARDSLMHFARAFVFCNELLLLTYTLLPLKCIPVAVIEPQMSNERWLSSILKTISWK